MTAHFPTLNLYLGIWFGERRGGNFVSGPRLRFVVAERPVASYFADSAIAQPRA